MVDCGVPATARCVAARLLKLPLATPLMRVCVYMWMWARVCVVLCHCCGMFVCQQRDQFVEPILRRPGLQLAWDEEELWRGSRKPRRKGSWFTFAC